MTVQMAEDERAPALDREACYRALRARDARFDGRFYTAVVSTGIYCRPICPARLPKFENCIFLPSAAAAHELGFRPCLRCRPELAPGLAGFRGSANTVTRALALIVEGGLDDDGVDALAERLGVGARHLRRLFDRHVGASPVAVAQAHRILFAKRLLSESTLSMAQVALAAGFGSVRRFNDVFRHTYERTPSAFKRGRSDAHDDPLADGPAVTLKLAYSPPYDFASLLEFLALRAIPGVERVADGVYTRSFALGAARGTVSVSALAHEPALSARIRTTDVAALSRIVARLRRLFDLDADSATIDAQLARSKPLAVRVRARPGVRVPGAWDGFELAVRAVLGQQISVKAATTIAGRIVARCGRPLADDEGAPAAPRMLFPTPRALAAADLTSLGLTSARSSALRALGARIADDERLLHAAETLPESLKKLTSLPGFGPWTAQYVAMRALREPDAFPTGDLGLLRALAENGVRPTPKRLGELAEAWRPFRAYAALRLWMQSPG